MAVRRALERQGASEPVVTAFHPSELPPEADVLLTLLDDPAAVSRLLRSPSIRWVHVLGAGVDGFPFIDLKDRLLTCSRGAAAPAIAEWVLAVMLAFEKHIPESFVREPPARWSAADLGGLAGKTLSVVGLGSIGSAVARRAVAFDMEVLATRRSGGDPRIRGVRLVPELTEALRAADHLLLAAASTRSTRHLLDAEALAQTKPGVHVINVARGALVDQGALLRALDRGHVARASLDVADPEPLPAGHPLYSHQRVRLSPHISWSGPGTLERTFDHFVENLRRWRSGQGLLGVVDIEAGY